MMETIFSKNPANSAVLKEIHQTALSDIPKMIQQARAAQKIWAKTTVEERARIVRNAGEYILDNVDSIADLICAENGKPKTEAITNDLIPALDALVTYCNRAPKLLADRKLSLRWLKIRESQLQFWPKGVVAVISPWNYPFSIPFGEIVQALLAGNAVIFKPSEVTTLVGMKIAEIFEHACLPKDLLQLVAGDGMRGAEIIKTKVDKVVFTGSVATGKKVMSAAAESLTPVILELGGKDPMIVLHDADIDFATSAALWGAFSNSGQACASIERIIVHESIHDAFVSGLNEKLKKLQIQESTETTDLGYITFENQKKVYQAQLSELNSSNAKIITGGKFNQDSTRLEPTIVTNPDGAHGCPIESTQIFNEETFGPVAAVTKFRTVTEAVEKANKSKYGLLASVIGRDRSMCNQVARQLECGTVLINEVLYTHGLAETPWGGVKETGIGRVHSDMGFMEFVNVRHVHRSKRLIPAFKAFWWFPYSTHQLLMFRSFMNVMYRRSWTRKLLALPHMLVDFIQMIKREPRI